MSLEQSVYEQMKHNRDIQNMNFIQSYNKGIANQIRKAELESFKKFPEPELIGGGMKSGAMYLPDESDESYYDVMATGGKVNRLKKSEQWSKFVRDLVPKDTRKAVVSRVNREISGGAKKGASEWIQHVKRYQQIHGVSYKQAMKEASDSYRN